MRRHLLVAVLALAASACPKDDDRDPPTFRVLSPLLLTFEGQESAVIVDVDRRARFSVIDPEGLPRGTAVAEEAGLFEVPFDPKELPLDVSTNLQVVAVSDSGGRATAQITVRHGALGLEVLSGEIFDAVMLTSDRIFLASDRGLMLQDQPASPVFDGPLATEGGERLVVAAGPAGDAFAAGLDDVVLHYDATGELCDRIELLPTQIPSGEQDAAEVVDLATQFTGGAVEVTAAHDLGFSGFPFTSWECADNGCATVDDCAIDPANAFSTGTCLINEAGPDFRGTAVAIDGVRIYSGGYTFTVRKLDEEPIVNVCADLGLPPGSDPIDDIAVSEASIWIAVANSVSRVERDFEMGGGIARPSVERYGEGRTQGDGLDVLPDLDIQTLTPVAPGADPENPTDGVWFGTPSGLGRIIRTGSSAEIAWVSGRSLPGRSVRAILAPADNPGLLWVATDDGLARLLLPDEP